MRGCVDSVLAQTLKDIEIILVDDGSTDACPAMADEYAQKDSRVVVLHLPNGGYGKALNIALEQAKGEYVGIVEPDDWIEPDMFEHLWQKAQQTQADVVKAVYCRECHGKTDVIDKFKGVSEGEYAPADVPEYLWGAPSIWTAIYNRQWLKRSGIRFSETPGAAFQDLGFVIRTWAFASSIAISHKPVYHYREDNPASSTRKLEAGAWEVLRELQLQQDVYELFSHGPVAMRSILAKRIMESMLPDYRRKVHTTAPEYLQEYSTLMRTWFAPETLDAEVTGRVSHADIALLCRNPEKFPRGFRSGLNVLKRLFSCRREGGARVLRVLFLTFVWRG